MEETHFVELAALGGDAQPFGDRFQRLAVAAEPVVHIADTAQALRHHVALGREAAALFEPGIEVRQGTAVILACNHELAQVLVRERGLTLIPAVNGHGLRTQEGLLATSGIAAVSYTHLRAHETPEHLVCRLLLEKKKKKKNSIIRS